MPKFYCECCNNHINVETTLSEDNNIILGDIVCIKCSLVIVTITTDKLKTCEIVKAEDLVKEN